MDVEISRTNTTVTGLPLRWEQLPAVTRYSLTGKIEGLYGRERAPEAFAALALDKQQALLLLFQQLSVFGLWPHLRLVENVYGLGGVGMNFAAWPDFGETLRWHRKFTKRLANRYNTDGGFRETEVRNGGLHLLFNGHGEGRRWDAHFDIYNPVFSPANTARHLWHEFIHSRTPDWVMVRDWLAQR